MKKFLFLIILVFHFVFSFSQSGRNWDKPMELQKCSINIKADLFTATTFIEMEFYNPNNQEIEGLYRFQLLPGQAVTALQLDLSGKFRDGSIEEKWKAANAYNTIVGKRVDPALLQMDGYNSYSLRIYPVPAKSTRRISLTIQQALKAEKGKITYRLPLTSKNTVQQFSVDATVNHTTTKASANEGLLKPLQFTVKDAAQQLQFSAGDFSWDKSISFSIPLPQEDVVCIKTEGEKSFFALRHLSAVAKEVVFHPKSIALFWDVSFSGSKRNIEKEISFLKQYIAYYNIADLTIIPFNYKAKTHAHFQIKEKTDWVGYLRSLTYEGATRFGNLDFNLINADAVFFLSDGYNSLGTSLPRNGKQPVFCIHASSIADNNTLNTIISNSGGKNIDLQMQTISEAIAAAGNIENKLLDIRSASGKTLIDVEEFDEEENTIFLSGTTLSEGDTLLFEYGNNSSIATVEKLVIHLTATCSHTATNRLPALVRFDALLKKHAWQELLFFGKDEKMVTYNTSFIVLEKADDYVKFNIEPPKNLEEECEKMQPGFLVRNKQNNREERLRQQQQHSQFEILTNVVNHYNQRVQKWGSYDLVNLSKPDVENVNRAGQKNETGASANLPGYRADFMGDASLSEVVIVDYSSAKKRQITSSVTTIYSREFSNSATSIEQALSGRVAGLMITPDAGFSKQNPSSIRIRGIASINNNVPLFVLDGIPISGDVTGNFNINQYVTVADIQQIDVLKDASATALYGSRGANGVIVIQTKSGKSSYWNYNPGPHKLKAMEDVDYLQEIKEVNREEKWAKYKELQTLHQNEAGFYLDMAQHLHENGFKEEAMIVLTTAAEVLPGNFNMQRTIAFFMEQWGEWEEAVALYEEILKASSASAMAYYDLGVAYAQSKQYKKAIDILYQGIAYDYGTAEYPTTAQQKEILLNELNAIVAVHRQELDLIGIPAAIIKPLPVDLRIVVEGNNGNMYGATIVEPNGKQCIEWQTATANGGYFTQIYNYYYGNHIKEYQIKQAVEGRYKIRVNYYDYQSGISKQPGVIKISVYKNFGKPNQIMTVENVMMDNQQGEIEVSEVKF